MKCKFFYSRLYGCTCCGPWLFSNLIIIHIVAIPVSLLLPLSQDLCTCCFSNESTLPLATSVVISSVRPHIYSRVLIPALFLMALLILGTILYICLWFTLYNGKDFCIRIAFDGNYPEVQWLRLQTLTTEGPGSTPGRGTKIPQATWHSQKKNSIWCIHDGCPISLCWNIWIFKAQASPSSHC